MPAKLYVVHGSHPCATVERALELKGIPYKVVELLPPMHAALQRVRFGQRTVPGIKFEDGEKVVGSRAILRRLETLVPDPPLLPADAEQRAKVEEAERWGDEVLQAPARRILWNALRRDRGPLESFSQGARLGVPLKLAMATAAPVVALSARSNEATDEKARADLAALPGYLDKIDAWIADGTMGAAQPNAADYQVSTSVRLLMALDDVRPAIASRPAGQLAARVVPDYPGKVPPILPAEWLTPLKPAGVPA